MSKFSERHPIFSNILRLILLLAFGIVLFYGIIICLAILIFGTPHIVVGLIATPLVSLGLFLGLIRLCWGGKLFGRIALALIVLPLCVAVPYYGHLIWHEKHYPRMEQEVKWWKYKPYSDGNKLVKATVPPELQITNEDYPRLDGAYALYPIYAAVAQAMYPAVLTENYKYLRTNGSDVIFDELLKDERDLIFALAPSAKQQADAEAAGVTYELTPFCQDAFVFFVNIKNPIDSLTIEQIRGIYSGEITDWQEVGAPESTKIIPFQRNEGSGSQTTLQKLMGDRPIMPPLKEDRVGGMGGIIHDVAAYRNYQAALGFSFRFYATEMLYNNQLKLLAIDGVAPTVENIQNGTYPLVTTAYIVSAKPRSESAKKIVDFLLSPEGQRLVQETGYVPIGPTTSE
ncbi:MAG: substrate-binding domain-containing protein [Victivallales bacterium]|nr:substrate-binding domain-containing protein [Victivallales bacterium]